jgi:integrase
VLAQVLESAVEGGLLARNAAEGIKLPKVQRKEMLFLSVVQVEALAAAIRPPYGTLIRFAAYSGLRRSELTALKVGRLDLLHGTARVVAAAPEIDGRLHFGGVKTHEARTVRLPRSVAEELGAYLAGRPHGPEDLVFTAPLGGPLRPHTWIKGFFKPAVRAAGLPEDLRLYDLRHSCASLLIAQGATVKAVQAQLGHATASITPGRLRSSVPVRDPMAVGRHDG